LACCGGSQVGSSSLWCDRCAIWHMYACVHDFY